MKINITIDTIAQDRTDGDIALTDIHRDIGRTIAAIFPSRSDHGQPQDFAPLSQKQTRLLATEIGLAVQRETSK